MLILGLPPNFQLSKQVGDLSICARSGAPCALLATHLVCVLVLTNSMEATAEEKEVPAEVLRAVFAHGAAGARDARVVSS